MPPDPTNITLLIESSRKGDKVAHDKLFELVYEELRQVARRSRFVAADGHTMQPTALANEAYLVFNRRYPIPPPGERESRETFFRTVALAMRSILRDYWRAMNAEKRGGDEMVVALGEHDPKQTDDDADELDFLALDEALEKLARRNERWYTVVLHRYFAGRTIAETAELLGLATTTVETDWKLAKGWLKRELAED